mgnify:CR=1 FL=1
MNLVTNRTNRPQNQSQSDSDERPWVPGEFERRYVTDQTPHMSFDFLKEGRSYQKPKTNETLRQGLQRSGDYKFESHERPEFKSPEVEIDVPFRIPVETKIGPYRIRGTKEGSFQINLGTSDDFIDHPWTESSDYPIEFVSSPRVLLLRSHNKQCRWMDFEITNFMVLTNYSPTLKQLVDFFKWDLELTDISITRFERDFDHTETVVYPEEVVS